MQENEFEKRVQVRMEELKLRPSEAVWETVAADIRERRRRRLLFMLSFTAAALLLLWGGYQYWHTGLQPQVAPAHIAVQKDDPAMEEGVHTKEVTQKHTAAKEEQAAGNQKISETGADKTINGRIGATASADEKIQPFHAAPSSVLDKDIAKTLNRSLVKPLVPTQQPVKLKADKSFAQNDNGSIAGYSRPADGLAAYNGLENALLLSKKDNEVVDLKKTVPAGAFNNLAAKQVPVLHLPVVSPLATGVMNTKIGLTFSGAVATRSKQVFEFISKEKKEALPSSDAITAGPSYNLAGSGGILILPPSEIKPGASFKVGMVAEKPLSRKIAVSAGLQYAFSSDNISIGKAISSTSFYGTNAVLVQTASSGSSADKRNYTNKYRFIEMPVAVHFTLNKKWKNPVIWNTGMSVGRLISSNALLYDIAWGGVYYDGSKEIKKTQVTVFTGIAARFTVNRLQWEIGPQVSVGTSKMFESSYDKNQYPLSLGLNMRVLLPVKRK